MAALSPEQRKVLDTIISIGRRKGASPKEVKSAVETGLVESGLRNLNHGDADSKGWRQERPSLYKDPTNLEASVGRYFDETSAVKHKYGSAGALAAAVQRPAAQYRGRYQERASEADAILAQMGGKGPRSEAARSAGLVPGKESTETSEEFDEAGFEQARRKSVVANFLSKRNPNSLLLKTGAISTDAPDPAQFTSTKTTTERLPESTAVGSQSGKPTRTGSELDAPSDLVKAVQRLDSMAGKGKVPITAKQEPGHASGGDHDPAVKGATARDFGGSEESRKALFEAITGALGVEGEYKGADINVVKNGIRYQIISRDHGTGPHLHVGLRKA